MIVPTRREGWRFIWGLSAADLLSALLVLPALDPASLAYQCFNIRPLRWIGRIRYGACVLHDIPDPLYRFAAKKIVFHLPAGGQFLPRILAAVFALPATLILSWFSHRYFERPFLN